MENFDCILDSLLIERGSLELVERVSKNGNSYKACMLCVGGNCWQIGFEKDYYVLKKYLFKGGKK